MALRLSDGLKNFVLNGGAYADAFNQGTILVYSGAQPSSANAAPQGTLLAVITDASQTHTDEVLAAGSIELATGSAGSVDTLTVDGVAIIDGPVAFNTSLAQTANDLASAINNSSSSPEYTATAASGTVTIRATLGAGASANGFVVAATLTTLTANTVDMAGGVSPANGLKFNRASGGSITKRTGQSWSGAGLANGTAGWARFISAKADGGGTDAVGAEIRMDGAIATSGAEFTMTSLTVASGAAQTITDFELFQS